MGERGGEAMGREVGFLFFTWSEGGWWGNLSHKMKIRRSKFFLATWLASPAGEYPRIEEENNGRQENLDPLFRFSISGKIFSANFMFLGIMRTH